MPVRSLVLSAATAIAAVIGIAGLSLSAEQPALTPPASHGTRHVVHWEAWSRAPAPVSENVDGAAMLRSSRVAVATAPLDLSKLSMSDFGDAE